MLVALANDPRHRSALLAAIPDRNAFRILDSAGELRGLMTRAECFIACLQEWDASIPLLQEIRREAPCCGVVAILPRRAVSQPDGTRALCDVLLSPGELRTRLPGAIAEARARRERHRLASLIENAKRLPYPLGFALVAACRMEPTPATVKRFTLRSAISRRTVEAQWKRAVWPMSGCTLRDFVAALVLLEALAMRHRHDSWRRVALELGTSPRRLRSISHLVFGADLRALWREQPERPADCVARKILCIG